MNNKTCIVLVSTMTVFAALASAQPGGRVSVPNLPPPAASAGMSAAASGAARAPVVPASSAAAASMHANGAVAPSTGVNVNATNHASAQGQANGLAVASVASNRASTTVNMADTVKSIHAATFAERDEVTTEVKTRLEASEKLVGELHTKAEASGEKSRAAFAKALVEVRKEQKKLRASLRAATKAADETSWGKVQSDLAANYGDYAKAVADAEVAANDQDDVTVTPKS
jgi:hypothetical protein